MPRAEQDALAGGFWSHLGPRDRQLVSRDLDEVGSLLRREVGPQQYELQGRGKPFATRIQFKQLDDVMLSHAWFAPALVIVSTPAKPYYTLFSRLDGASEYSCQGRVFVTSPSRGAILPGMRPVRVRTREDWHVFGTRFDPAVMDRELSRMLGRPVTRAVEFDPMVDFERGAGAVLKRLLMRLYQEAGRPDFESAKSTLAIKQLERSLITLVLEGLRHNYSKLVNGRERGIAPWQVRAVEEFVHENASQPLSLGQLASVGGVSARSLQYAFRVSRGYTPTEFLRRVRLERARDDLARTEDPQTVTLVAMRWGFLHLGRFAMEYRRRFHESPSETLRRSLRRK
jgi:AraC-like DNA-binding protein